jgi:hypothetical protein
VTDLSFEDLLAAIDRLSAVEKQLVADRLRQTEPLSPEEEAELHALQFLSDDALWTIARAALPGGVADRMHNLMDKNTLGTITPVEYDELAALVDRSERLMLRRSEAMRMLRGRGYDVSVLFSQNDD